MVGLALTTALRHAEQCVIPLRDLVVHHCQSPLTPRVHTFTFFSTGAFGPLESVVVFVSFGGRVSFFASLLP